MVRVSPDNNDRLLEEKDARLTGFTGSHMKGYLYVDATGGLAADTISHVESTGAPTSPRRSPNAASD